MHLFIQHIWAYLVILLCLFGLALGVPLPREEAPAMPEESYIPVPVQVDDDEPIQKTWEPIRDAPINEPDPHVGINVMINVNGKPMSPGMGGGGPSLAGQGSGPGFNGQGMAGPGLFEAAASAYHGMLASGYGAGQGMDHPSYEHGPGAGPYMQPGGYPSNEHGPGAGPYMQPDVGPH